MVVGDHLYVITGGPGSGKTSLVAALAETGLQTVAEAGRAIIQDQVAIGGEALPWANRQGFADLMLGWELRSHRESRDAPVPVILDRGIPDVLGYLTLCRLPVPSHVRKAAETYRYNRCVFVAPPWPEIYRRDAERRQGLDEAVETHDTMVRVYGNLGYEVVPLPMAGIAERVAFVCDRMPAANR